MAGYFVVAFLPGLQLSRRLYADVVAPVLADRFPGLRFAAARVDSGSELFGFDGSRSTDHDWGPRLQLFVEPPDAAVIPSLLAAVEAGLPPTLAGWPTRFAGHPAAGLGLVAADGDRSGVSGRVLHDWLVERLGLDPRAGLTTLDWLTLPSQRLAEITSGAVFADTAGGLTAVRRILAWYPDDVWRYVLAAQWRRIAQEESFVGRCAEAGDDLGSAVVAARLARDLMRLCLLLGRRYPPYGKWLGTGFARLPGIAPVAAALAAALAAPGWPEREAALCAAYEAVAERSNAAGLAPAVDPAVRGFHRRPYRVLGADRFAAVLQAAIGDPALRAAPLLGAVDQIVDNTDVTTRPVHFRRAVHLLGPNDR